MRRVATSKFKAQLAKYLRLVRQGEELEILDRKLPIAKVSPIQAASPRALVVREPLEPGEELDKIALAPVSGGEALKLDSLAALLEERGSR